MTVKDRLPAIFITTLLLLFALSIILPFFLPWSFVFKTRLEFAYDPWGWPEALRWDNFVSAWNAIRIGHGLLNTLYVSLGAIICTVPPAAMAGYVFARYQNRVTEIVFYAILAGYFVPVLMVLIPLYQLATRLGLANSFPGLFLPMAAFGIPFWTIIYRSFFRSLPSELAEAAHIDGAGHFAVFFRIMLPLAKPATYLAVLLVFIGAWSDYLLSLIMLSDQHLFTMQLRIAQFLNQYGTSNMPRYAAGVIISLAPTTILYVLGQRWILKGTLAGALKG